MVVREYSVTLTLALALGRSSEQFITVSVNGRSCPEAEMSIPDLCSAPRIDDDLSGMRFRVAWALLPLIFIYL